MGKVASGASRIGYWRYEREEGDRLKCAINESTLSTADAVPLPQGGRLREGGFAAKKEANPASLRSAAPSKGRGSRGHSLFPMEGGRMSPYRLSTKKAYDMRMPLSRIVISSESEKSFSFAVRQRM